MKGDHQVRRTTQRAKSRDRKRQPRMNVSGKGVFTLQNIKHKPKR